MSMFWSILVQDTKRETVLDRELDSIVRHVPAIRIVVAVSPLVLRAEHKSRYRVAENVDQGVLSGFECVCGLPLAISDIDPRIAECAGELRIPIKIEKADHTESSESASPTIGLRGFEKLL